MKKIIVNSTEIAWEENMNIDRILLVMKYTFKMIIVKVNGDLVKKVNYHSFIVPENADVKVIHLMSGG
jgi:sulfur carrier protein